MSFNCRHITLLGLRVSKKRFRDEACTLIMLRGVPLYNLLGVETLQPLQVRGGIFKDVQ